jgi:hypothetical protein
MHFPGSHTRATFGWEALLQYPCIFLCFGSPDGQGFGTIAVDQKGGVLLWFRLDH